jgi:dephospho-CoA kinase
VAWRDLRDWLDLVEANGLLKHIAAPVEPDEELGAITLLATRREDAPALLFEIPLLFETHGEKDFDKVIVVSAPADVQRARALERPGMTEEKLASILERQMPDEEKRRRADFVIDTGTNLSTTEGQVSDIIACLGLAAGR